MVSTVPLEDHESNTTYQGLSWDEWKRKVIEGHTLIFDGQCVLCNGMMHWYFDRIPNESNANNGQQNLPFFVWAQHDKTTRLMSELGISDIMESWAYFEKGKLYRSSSAWLRASRHLTFPWNKLHLFECVPLFIRDSIYFAVAKNRYWIFGKYNVCKQPSKAIEARFLHNIAN